jgi:two-component system chemotaxis response regulator CheB
MPAGFTAAFARDLASRCALEVREAADRDELRPGLALIAKGGSHLRVHARRERRFVEVAHGPLVSRHRPSVDVLFRSVAATDGARTVGVILTGMGSDGAEGLAAMHAAGAVTIAQDEASSVVWGMPSAAIERGVVSCVASLAMIPRLVMDPASARERSASMRGSAPPRVDATSDEHTVRR